ncbi:MAG: hypothetical protein RR271_08150, partial [Oscillospiraceae bacterium]
ILKSRVYALCIHPVFDVGGWIVWGADCLVWIVFGVRLATGGAEPRPYKGWVIWFWCAVSPRAEQSPAPTKGGWIWF